MRAGILAAGVGRRLGQGEDLPKILLEFGGRSLLERHLALLRDFGVSRVDMVVGYRCELIEAELGRLGAADFVRYRFNPDYRAGSILSLARLGEAMRAGEPFLFLDGDLLYDQRVLRRLAAPQPFNAFLFDRKMEEGEDPIRLCFRGDSVVDLQRYPVARYDWWGEWLGIARFDAQSAGEVAEAADRLIAAGERAAICEAAMGAVVRRMPGRFGAVDATGLPWVEIDFAEDLARARSEVFPRLLSLPAAGAPARQALGGTP
jgi:choline kinase